ncbi:hypothetical protein ACFL4F_04130, partial [Candidatus Margulisiibacteriota bacterium]
FTKVQSLTFLKSTPLASSIFEKASITLSKIQQKNLGGPFPASFNLDMEKLTLVSLDKQEIPRERINTFINDMDHDRAVRFLRKLGALQKNYKNPIINFLGKRFMSWMPSDIGRFMDKYFEELICNTRRGEVSILFNRIDIKGSASLTEAVKKHKLETDGRILHLFMVALEAVADVAPYDLGVSYKLNLARLTPLWLTKQNINIDEVDETIESSDHDRMIKFLEKIRALRIKSIREPVKRKKQMELFSKD